MSEPQQEDKPQRIGIDVQGGSTIVGARVSGFDVGIRVGGAPASYTSEHHTLLYPTVTAPPYQQTISPKKPDVALKWYKTEKFVTIRNYIVAVAAAITVLFVVSYFGLR